jgi:cobalt-zinc-cadmium efflux system outer membrane protein
MSGALMMQHQQGQTRIRVSFVNVLAGVGLLLVGAGAGLRAQTPIPGAGSLNLGQVYRAVETVNPRIAAAGALARAAGERIAPARRPTDPQLQFALMNRSLPGFGLSDPLGMNQVQLMQMLPFPGKLRMAGEAASARAEAEQSRASDVSWDVRARAAMAFYELYQMDRSLQVADETLRILRDLAATARTMYVVGEGRQADVLRAQVEIARMSEDITRMGAERVAAAARLNALLVADPSALVGSPVRPAFPDSLPPLDSLIAAAERNRPMLQAAEAEVRAADAGARLARREIWPDLQLGVQYGQRPMDGETDRMLSLMFGVNVPIFAGSRQFAMRREAAAMREMAVADLDAMRAETRGRVAELYASAERARRLGALYSETILPQANTTVASALAAYRTGSVDFMTLLDDQMTVNQYRQDLYALDAERGQALAELEMLLARPLFNPDDAVVASGGSQ